MTTHYQAIFSDLMEIEPEEVELPRLPSLEEFDALTKINILYKMYKRAALKGKSEHMIFYMYSMGKWIMSYDLEYRDTKLSRHYFLIARRAYLLFEHEETQIMRTKQMNLTNL